MACYVRLSPEWVAFLGTGALTGGRFHLRLNINTRPIVNKYREGKVKRTLKRGLKEPEVVKGEADTVVDWILLELITNLLLWCFSKRFVPSKFIEVVWAWCIHVRRNDIDFGLQTMTATSGSIYGFSRICCCLGAEVEDIDVRVPLLYCWWESLLTRFQLISRLLTDAATVLYQRMSLPTLVFVPSWNTDQGVNRMCKCVDWNSMCVMKVTMLRCCAINSQ